MLLIGPLTQLVEFCTYDARVVGSIPTRTIPYNNYFKILIILFTNYIRSQNLFFMFN